MLKKTFFVLLICSFFIGGFVLAEDTASVGILPNSPFYFIKDMGREIQSFLTFNPTKKAELRLEIVEEKLAEIETLSEKDPDNVNYDKYLENYQKSLERFQNRASVLVKDSDQVEKILDNITRNTFDHESRLEQLKQRIQAKKIDHIKDKIVQIYTKSSLDVASPEKIQKKIQLRVDAMEENSNTDQVLRKMKENAPTLSPYLEQINTRLRVRDENGEIIQNQQQVRNQLQGVVTQNDLLEKMNTDASNLGITPEEVLEQVGNMSEKDQKKLQSYAVDLLTGNKSAQDIVEDVQEMELSTDAQNRLNVLQHKVQERRVNTDIKSDNNSVMNLTPTSLANPASTKCVNDGYKLDIRTGSDGGEYGVCISSDGQECEEWKYFRGECVFE